MENFTDFEQEYISGTLRDVIDEAADKFGVSKESIYRSFPYNVMSEASVQEAMQKAIARSLGLDYDKAVSEKGRNTAENLTAAAAERQAQYPWGTRIIYRGSDADKSGIPNGTTGTVDFVDDAGTVFCTFDNGKSVGITYSEENKIRPITNVWITRDREAGNVIEWFGTYEEAKAAVSAYEADDERNGYYTPDFYEIVPMAELQDAVVTREPEKTNDSPTR